MKHRVIGLTAIAIVALASGSVWAWKLTHAVSHASESTVKPSHAAGPTTDEPSEKWIVTLPEGKRASAGVVFESVQSRVMQSSVVVPGRVQYDDTRHVEIRASTDCVVSTILVKPGDRVTAGKILAVLISPEVGTARANVLQRRADWKLAERAAEWELETCDNLAKLVKAIDSHKPLKELRAEFQNRKLGDHRATLLTAYARSELAQSLITNLDRLTAVLPERTVQERLSEAEAAQAALVAVCEQSTFDARKRCDTAQAATNDARRRLEIAQQQLTTLLGYREEVADENSARGDTVLSHVECRAPFAGTIERKTYSVSERVKPGDSLFVLADTTQLWIAADLREREWSLLNATPDAELTVESPALPNRKLTARVHFVGREVSADSHAVPLVAKIDNTDGLLRPGLFVRVTIPGGDTTPRLVVPSSAIVEHDRQKFVFVRDSDNEYRRVDVTTGLETGGLVEITHGLAEGVSVVTRGAFVLKSELLLEAE